MNKIRRLADCLSATCRSTLRGGRFRIGPAQKVLNMYIRYLWCLGPIPEPSRCPAYSILLKRAGVTRIAWMRMDSLNGCLDCIAAIRHVVGERSLVEWECEVWNEAIP